MAMGSIKKMLYNAIIASLIFYVIIQSLSGIETSGQLSHTLMSYAVFAVANMLVTQIIKFLTIPKNALTYFLISGVLSFAALYGMSIFLPGITIGSTIIDPVSAGVISIEPFSLSPTLTMVLAGVVSGLLNAVLYWLDKE